MSRVVVTGLGAVSALGVGCETFWSRLAAGESGLRPMQRLDASGLRNELAGEVPEEAWQAAAAPDLGRAAGYGWVACREAARQAGLSMESWPGATVLATNFGGQQDWWDADDAADRLPAVDCHNLADTLAARGPRITLSNACSSGTNALGLAADLVRTGQAEVALACGFDELGLFCLSGLSILHTVTAETIRPFDARRSGTIFAEGAGALVVESAEHAAARGAQPLAEVLGYGVNNNAFHMTAPDKGGAGMVAAIGLALAQAGINADAIDHVNAHATGTEYHDPAETDAIKTVMGQRAYAIPVSAIKAATGHAMGAAGAIEAVACVLALQHQQAPPTLNLEEPDPLCDLDVVTGTARAAEMKVALSVSAGLGGNNSAVLLGVPA